MEIFSASAASVCLSDDGSSDDEFFRLFILPSSVQKRRPKHGGSSAGKRAGKARDRAELGARLMADYFGPNPTYDEHDFRRRFRMRRSLFETIVNTLSKR
ncbi:hypothetical protein GN958_ATG08735 [Phytophthora infestans]|uniref:Uncharacterized protein n=1 Tax=Phytophthora infestans TaxID=4787 RepID=A0A8S9UMD0_PHYIN|nr:hypothetical protein GN958_ATG08735 [Phytophthora infestans]